MPLKAVVESFTQPATLGHSAHQFLDALDKKLSTAPTREEYDRALAETLELRRFRNLTPGLRALAEAAWIDKGETGIKCYLKQQAEIAFDADTRDRWNRDVRQTMGPILQSVVRAGKKEITTADTVQAFALEHGLPLLQETIRDRYQPPRTEDREAWRKQVAERLREDLAKWPDWEVKLDLAKVDELTANLTSTFDSWLAMPEPEQRKLWDKFKTLAADLEKNPAETLGGLFKDAAWRLNRVPTEANLTATVALSLVLAAKAGIAVTSAPMAIGMTLAMLAGWYVADLQGAIFHWNKDNYPKGRVGREFIDHHYNPTAVSKWPLRRNADGTSRPVLPAMAAAAAFIPGGALPAFLLTLLNGIIYTQHVHGFSHARQEDLPKAVRTLQKASILLSPDEHTKHHGRPLGKEAYGVLNGWSNYVSDGVQFFRWLELAREKLTGEKPTWEHEPEVRKVAMERKKKGGRSLADC